MELGAIVVGLVLLIAGLLFVVKPFNAKKHKKSNQAVAALKPEEARIAALSALRELDFDFRLGKVSEEDHARLRAQLVAEAAKYVDAENEQEDKIEALIRARKKTAAHEKVCNKCGKTLEADARFCPHCGADMGAVCSSCGGTVKAGDTFCTSCGTKLEVGVAVTV